MEDDSKATRQRKSDVQASFESPGAKKTVHFCETIHMETVERWDKKRPRILAISTMSRSQKANIKKEMNKYKLKEMMVHPASKQYLSMEYNGKPEKRKWKKECRERIKELNSDLYLDHPEDIDNEREISLKEESAKE